MYQIKSFDTNYSDGIRRILYEQHHLTSDQHDDILCYFCKLANLPVYVHVVHNHLIVTYANGHSTYSRLDVSLTHDSMTMGEICPDSDSFADTDVYRDKLPLAFDEAGNITKYYTIERTYEDHTLYIVTNHMKKEIITLKNSQIIGCACYSEYHQSVFQLVELQGTYLVQIKSNDTCSIVRIDDVVFYRIQRLCAIPNQNNLVIVSNSNICWLDPLSGYVVHNIYFDHENPLNGDIAEPILDEFVDCSCTQTTLMVISKCLSMFGAASYHVIFYDVHTYRYVGCAEIDIGETFTIGYVPNYDMGVVFSLAPDKLYFLYNTPDISKPDMEEIVLNCTDLNRDLAELVTQFTHGSLF